MPGPGTRMFRAFADWVRPPPIRSAPALHAAVERAAARVTVQGTVNYCRVKAAGNAKKLFGEAAFQDALHVCRWEAYAAVLADALRVAEAYLRPAGDPELAARIAAGMSAFYAASLAVQPRPQPNGAEGWAPLVAEFEAALARARMAPPAAAAEIATGSGNRMFDLLPIHKSLRREDREVLVNQVRFGLVTLRQDLERRVDRDAVRADYADAAGRP